jgi:hypothetical protein
MIELFIKFPYYLAYERTIIFILHTFSNLLQNINSGE